MLSAVSREGRFPKPRVAGSIPVGGTIYYHFHRVPPSVSQCLSVRHCDLGRVIGSFRFELGQQSLCIWLMPVEPEPRLLWLRCTENKFRLICCQVRLPRFIMIVG